MNAMQPQWESGNSTVSFPFADNSIPDAFPAWIIVDACLVVPRRGLTEAEAVTLECLHVSRHMVAASFAVGDRPILACQVLAKEYEPFLPRKMDVLDPMCSGMITFGDIRFEDFSTPFMFRHKIPLSEAALVRPVVGRLERFIRPDTGQTASGDVDIVLPDGVNMATDNELEGSSIRFSAKESSGSLVERPCDGVETPLTPIRSINGVFPDIYGNIAIVFSDGSSDGE